MNDKRKKNAIVISSIAVLAVIAMVIAVAATTPLICPGSGIITNVSVKNSGTGDAYGPGVTYMSHNITIEDNSAKVNVTLADWYTKVMYFNITGYNGTITNDDITNITIYNESGNSVFGFNNTITGNNSVNISSAQGMWVNNTAINFSVNITVNTTGLVDGAYLSPNVTLGVQQYNDTSKTFNCSNVSYANDTLAETINVLDATAGTSTEQASPGGTFVVVGNVTVDPGDNAHAVNLTNITFRVNTSATATNLTAADILHYALWKGANAVLDTGTDEKLDNTSATALNVSFNGLNSTISPGATNRYFLTMNLSKNIPYANMTYQGFVAAQNITINNGTGNYTATSEFTQLEIKDKITNLTSSVYDAAVMIKVNLTLASGTTVDEDSVNLSINNTNTSVVTDIIRAGVVMTDNGTALTNHSLTAGEIRVSMELQEGYYNFSTVYAENNHGGVIANDTTFNGIDFIVNMSGAALNVTPDNPALQDNGVAPRTAEENATINVTVVDKFGNKMVFNESDVNTIPANMTLIKTVGTGTVTISKITTQFFYPNNTRPVQWNVSDTAAETITLQALDIGPEGLESGSANQEFTPRIGGVDVYAADGEILADGVDYELVYLQLLDASGDPVSKEDIPVEWAIVNQADAGATVDKGDKKTNTTGIATLNITKATESGKTMTITGLELFTGSNYADSDTVLTKAGEVNNTNSTLYVNESDTVTQGTVNTTLNVGVLLMDSSGNLVVGGTVTLNANTSATFVDSTPTSDANGWANTTIRLPTEVNVTMVRAITGDGNTSLTPPELNQTVNVTSTPDVVTQIGVSPSKSIGLKSVPGTPKAITLQLKDLHGNANTTATASVLITTDNQDLGNMTNTTVPIKTVNNNLWSNITSDGNTTFTYTVNSSVEGIANLTVNVTGLSSITDTITITTSGPTGLNLTLNETLPLVGEGVMATAQLTGPIGDISIADVNITFTLRNPADSLIDSNSTVTDAAGIANYNFSQTTRGVYTIKAKNDDYGHNKTNTTTYVGNATQIWIAVNKTNPAVDETITVYAIFKDDAGYNSSSVNGDDVNFLADDSSFATGNIANGVATATYTQSTNGTVTIDVLYTNATKNPYWEGTVPTNSTSVTFGEEIDPYDANGDRIINLDELMTAIGDWKLGIYDLDGLMTTIGRWKAGSY